MAHSDFVKAVCVVSSLRLLISSSSDKSIRLWDLSTFEDRQPLQSVGSISAHTRPVSCLSAHALSETSAMLYTADTMGMIKAWELTKEEGASLRWRSVLRDELNHHRTRINEMVHENGQLWTASSDETVQVKLHPPLAPSSIPVTKLTPPLTHSAPVKSILPLHLTPLAEPYLLTGAGDIIRVYDISTPEEPELLGEVDAHWHDVIALRLWMRTTPVQGAKGQYRVEPWIVSTSLDGTIRKWRLAELLNPTVPKAVETKPVNPEPKSDTTEPFGMSEDEERELAELMDSE